MHLGDGVIIFVIALILFGPKKLPEMARQVAKLMAEFRRASNEFKTQIDEELRSAEQADRQKQISAQAVITPSTALPAQPATESTPTILPPSVGVPVSQYAYSEAGESPSTTADAPATQQTPELPYATQESTFPASTTTDTTSPSTHSNSHNGMNGMFTEASPTFGMPYAPEAPNGTAHSSTEAVTLPTETPAPHSSNGLNGHPDTQSAAESLEESIAGSAAEQAQASIHHG